MHKKVRKTNGSTVTNLTTCYVCEAYRFLAALKAKDMPHTPLPAKRALVLARKWRRAMRALRVRQAGRQNQQQQQKQQQEEEEEEERVARESVCEYVDKRIGIVCVSV